MVYLDIENILELLIDLLVKIVMINMLRIVIEKWKYVNIMDNEGRKMW